MIEGCKRQLLQSRMAQKRGWLVYRVYKEHQRLYLWLLFEIFLKVLQRIFTCLLYCDSFSESNLLMLYLNTGLIHFWIWLGCIVWTEYIQVTSRWPWSTADVWRKDLLHCLAGKTGTHTLLSLCHLSRGKKRSGCFLAHISKRSGTRTILHKAVFYDLHASYLPSPLTRPVKNAS